MWSAHGPLLLLGSSWTPFAPIVPFSRIAAKSARVQVFVPLRRKPIRTVERSKCESVEVISGIGSRPYVVFRTTEGCLLPFGFGSLVVIQRLRDLRWPVTRNSLSLKQASADTCAA